jgi:hypothetical protein
MGVAAASPATVVHARTCQQTIAVSAIAGIAATMASSNDWIGCATLIR